MPPPIIKSRSNPLVQTTREVRDGKDKSLLFCEGLKLVDELLSSSFKTTNILCVPKLEGAVRKSIEASGKTHVPVTLVDESVMESMSDLETSAGVIALAKKENKEDGFRDDAKGDLFLILPKVQLPQNLGAMIRSSEAAGVDAVWIGSGSADPFSPKGIRGSTGSIFRVAVKRGIDLAVAIRGFKEKEIRIVAATQNGSKYYDEVDWTRPTALVLGAEGSGFTKEQLALFDDTVKIPMKGKVESLNLGTAASICLFEAMKQRRSQKKGVSHGS